MVKNCRKASPQGAVQEVNCQLMPAPYLLGGGGGGEQGEEEEEKEGEEEEEEILMLRKIRQIHQGDTDGLSPGQPST